MQDISLTLFLPSGIVSFHFYIYMFIILFVLISHSLYFISEDDNSLTLLFVLELFHLTSRQPMSFILLS